MKKDKYYGFIGCLVFWAILAWIVVKVDRSGDSVRSETVESRTNEDSKDEAARQLILWEVVMRPYLHGE